MELLVQDLSRTYWVGVKCSVRVFDWGDAYGVGPAVFDVGPEAFVGLVVCLGWIWDDDVFCVFPVGLLREAPFGPCVSIVCRPVVVSTYSCVHGLAFGVVV